MSGAIPPLTHTSSLCGTWLSTRTLPLPLQTDTHRISTTYGFDLSNTRWLRCSIRPTQELVEASHTARSWNIHVPYAVCNPQTLYSLQPHSSAIPFPPYFSDSLSVLAFLSKKKYQILPRKILLYIWIPFPELTFCWLKQQLRQSERFIAQSPRLTIYSCIILFSIGLPCL
jgi:hypothetical protein